LTYHGITKNDWTHISLRHLPAVQFEEQLFYIRKYLNKIEIKSVKSKSRISRVRPISLSFDDGFRNFLTVALPLLEKYDVPATVFVCTDPRYTKLGQTLWNEQIALYLSLGTKYQKDYLFDFCKMHVGQDYQPSNINQQIRKLPLTELIYLFEVLNSKLNFEGFAKSLNPELYELLDHEEIAKLSKHPLVTIGSHGVLHRQLNAIPKEEAIIELNDSKRHLEEITEQPIKDFAYPFGEYNNNLVIQASEIGYTKQYIQNYQNKGDMNHPNLIKRIGVSSTTKTGINMLATLYK
jgi:peptidoglycan/xylan/chitin deacetylase (PgdA/CDA1 family)